jgi:hypothetical protein
MSWMVWSLTPAFLSRITSSGVKAAAADAQTNSPARTAVTAHLTMTYLLAQAR